MNRQELRYLVQQTYRDSDRSWVMAGLAFSSLAPFILAELDKAIEEEAAAERASATLSDEEFGRVG